MEAKMNELTQNFGRFKAALIHNDFDTISNLLSDLKVLFTDKEGGDGFKEQELRSPDLVALEYTDLNLTHNVTQVQRTPAPPKESKPIKDHVIKSRKGWKKIKLTMEGSSV